MSSTDPAETETAARKKFAFASTFDQLVAANLQLVTTVRTTMRVVAACAVISMVWSMVSTYSMRATLSENRVMLQSLIDTLAKAGH